MNLELNGKFLNKLKKEKKLTYVYLSNGVMLQGVISDYDDISLIIDDSCLVYYSNIISLIPADKKVKKTESK